MLQIATKTNRTMTREGVGVEAALGSAPATIPKSKQWPRILKWK
jgi:hypothetical protein